MIWNSNTEYVRKVRKEKNIGNKRTYIGKINYDMTEYESSHQYKNRN